MARLDVKTQDPERYAQVKAEQALVFPDEVSLEEGTVLTDELLMQAFVSGGTWPFKGKMPELR